MAGIGNLMLGALGSFPGFSLSGAAPAGPAARAGEPAAAEPSLSLGGRREAADSPLSLQLTAQGLQRLFTAASATGLSGHRTAMAMTRMI